MAGRSEGRVGNPRLPSVSMNWGTLWSRCCTKFRCASLCFSSLGASLRLGRNRPAPSPFLIASAGPLVSLTLAVLFYAVQPLTDGAVGLSRSQHVIIYEHDTVPGGSYRHYLIAFFRTVSSISLPVGGRALPKIAELASRLVFGDGGQDVMVNSLAV
jgi:hypothetical protein